MFNLVVNNLFLGGTVDFLIDNYLGPIYIFTVAVIAVLTLKDKKVREFFSFVGLATLVALCIYAGNFFFGKNGILTKSAQKAASTVNIVSFRNIK